jgi:hypothetical protein
MPKDDATLSAASVGSPTHPPRKRPLDICLTYGLLNGEEDTQMTGRHWCEHCETEFSPSGTVAVSDCVGRDGTVDTPTDGSGIPFRKRAGRFFVPKGEIEGYLVGNCCEHCRVALVAMERECE